MVSKKLHLFRTNWAIKLHVLEIAIVNHSLFLMSCVACSLLFESYKLHVTLDRRIMRSLENNGNCVVYRGIVISCYRPDTWGTEHRIFGIAARNQRALAQAADMWKLCGSYIPGFLKSRQAI